MCFSASASFTGSALLTVIGVATMQAAQEKKQKWIGAIPFIFAIQQFVEGWIWVLLNRESPPISLVWGLQYLYMAFIFFWPVWFPFALWKLEEKAVRKKILKVMNLLNVIYLALVLYMFIQTYSDLKLVSVCNFHLDYPEILQNRLGFVASALYLINLLGSPFISSFPKMWVLGFLGTILLIISYYISIGSHASVWCFLGAIGSAATYLILKKGNQKKRRNSP